MPFDKSPLDYIEDKNFDKRELYNIDIHWVAPVPGGGKTYKLWVLAKPHVEYMIFLMAVMSTDELFKIKQGIAEGLVPDYFTDIVEKIYQIKRDNAFLTTIHLTTAPIFDYTDHRKFDVPKQPKHQSRKLLTVVPAVHPKIPVATSKQIAQLLRKS